MPRTAVSSALATVEALVPEDDGSAWWAMREKPALRHNTVRRFLSPLDESDALGAAPAGRRILKAVRRLPALSRRRVTTGRCCPARSTPSWCPRCGSGQCSRTPSRRRAGSIGTRTWCACRSSCTAR
ncbi:hypothetical protein [Streptomyces sp. NPDC059994]|uniref:hypothetical protein n=1 Tax=Streptomyces sp. NPDC059994 TaxID=3347029 RepID=UPI0036768C82